ncbi:hypothetical protein XENTR_v10014158 [Xenopus tropicalis]|uniref:Cystatin-C n=1 Tax=Xenopus tropicalis TaxID=8364 RepID=F6RSF0_XENTR|nr:cystatin-C [Xenopus tropicalis]KAE8602868.1 hypothetical protein XENTR_v10014158 [Xenopus tropicalis]|eukprot:XP_002934915.1 PREDICTED: cystatin-C-like [Xenopus tropicalis]
MDAAVVVMFLMVAAAASASRGTAVGGLRPASVNEQGVQQAMAFAMEEYNKRSNDMFVNTITKVNGVTKQIVAGTLYRIDADIARTECKKSAVGVQNCPLHTDPDFVKSMNCKFEVFSVPWMRTISLEKHECS